MTCIGIVDEGCDNVGPYRLCKKGFFSPSSSCIYENKAYAEGNGLTCMNVDLRTTKDGNTWELGPCYTSHKLSSTGTYIEKCCVPNGEHLFACNSAQNNGWVNAYVRVEGHMFCDDIIGYNKFISIHNVCKINSNFTTSF